MCALTTAANERNIIIEINAGKHKCRVIMQLRAHVLLTYKAPVPAAFTLFYRLKMWHFTQFTRTTNITTQKGTMT